MAEKGEEVKAVKKQPKASDAKKSTKKTEAAADIDTVQGKKTLPVKRKAAVSKKPVVRSKKVKKAEHRDIGIDIEAPSKACEDENCPFHGTLSVRGIILDVQVVNVKMDHTVVVMRERRHRIEKYQRFEKRSSRFLAHLPPCVNVGVGDMVKVMECRPLSKSTNMVVVGRI
jgi:small subunit ribosomal protein S17